MLCQECAVLCPLGLLYMVHSTMCACGYSRQLSGRMPAVCASLFELASSVANAMAGPCQAWLGASGPHISQDLSQVALMGSLCSQCMLQPNKGWQRCELL